MSNRFRVVPTRGWDGHIQSWDVEVRMAHGGWSTVTWFLTADDPRAREKALDTAHRFARTWLPHRATFNPAQREGVAA